MSKPIVLRHETIFTTIIVPKSLQEEIYRLLSEILRTPVLDELLFTDAYKNGLIDGRISVFYDNKIFGSGLLGYVKRTLQNRLYEVKVIDKVIIPRRKPLHPYIFNDNEYALRNYQQEAVMKAIKNNGILALPTGSGKTVIAGKLISELNVVTCFIVPSRTLLYQTRKALSEMLVGIDIGLVGDSVVEVEKINVCSIQTLYSVIQAKKSGQQVVTFDKKSRKWNIEEKIDYDMNKINEIYDLINSTKHIIFDEAHHVSAESYTEVAREFKNAYYRHGLSATVWREDKKEIMIYQHLGGIIFKKSLNDLIVEGFLVKPKIEIYHVPNSPDVHLPKRYSAKAVTEYFTNNAPRNATIVSTTQRIINEGKYSRILILVQRIDHGVILGAMLHNAGVKVQTVNGKDKQKTREEAVEKLRNQELQVIVSTDIFGEGFDEPSIDCIVLAHMGRSSSKLVQYIGRALRKFNGKESALIVDFADNQKWFVNWFNARLGTYHHEKAFRDGLNNHWQFKAELLGEDQKFGKDRIIQL